MQAGTGPAQGTGPGPACEPYRGGVLRMLLRPRYLALSALMIVIAVICAGFGTWQISRLQWKIQANRELRHNAHAAPVAVGAVLPAVGAADAPPNSRAVQFRKITVTGSYDAAGQAFVRNRTIEADDGGDDDVPGSDTGYLLLTPLDTDTGTLLVVRGFVSGTTGASGFPALPTPPSGLVTITARVEPPETRHDDAATLPAHQVESINPVEQSARLGRPVYDGYAELLAGQPGSSGLIAIPSPDLTNPAGGAYEWQHLAYVIQWYLFALLALAAPILVSRHEAREAQRQLLGIDPDERPGLSTPEPAEPPVPVEGAPQHGAVAVRSSGAVQHRTPAEQDQIRRAVRLADRYGLPLEVPADRPVRPMPPAGRDGFVPAYERNYAPQRPGPTVHRSPDSYHGSYNDYLWQLALADGDVPDVAPPADVPDQSPRTEPPAIDASPDEA